MTKRPSKSKTRPLQLRRVRGLAASELQATTGGDLGKSVIQNLRV